MPRLRRGGLAESLAHLDKAREFLLAARSALRAGWHNATASNSVTAGINAKDAVCFALVGSSAAADDHRAAVAELRGIGPLGREAAPALERLPRLKDRAQYDRRGVSAGDATAGVRRAEALVGVAERAVGVG